MTRLSLTIVALGALFSAVSPSFAQDISTVHVRYSDLNLNSPTGVAKFESRIKLAMTEVCGDRNEVGAGRQVVQECWGAVAPLVHSQVASIISSERHDQLAFEDRRPR